MALSAHTAMLTPRTLNTEKMLHELCSSRTELNRMFACIRRWQIITVNEKFSFQPLLERVEGCCWCNGNWQAVPPPGLRQQGKSDHQRWKDESAERQGRSQSSLCVIGIYFTWLADMKFKIINVSLNMKIFCTSTVPSSAYKTNPQWVSTFPSASVTVVNVITGLQITKQQQSVSHLLCH